MNSLLNHNDHHGTPLWSKKLQEAVSRVMAETDEEEKDAKRNVNNVTMDHLFQSPAIISTQKERCKHDKLETNCLEHSCRNDERIQ